MEAQRAPDAYDEVDAVPVLAEDPGELAPSPSGPGAGLVVAKQAAAVAATSFAAGVATVATPAANDVAATAAACLATTMPAAGPLGDGASSPGSSARTGTASTSS